MSEHTDRPTDPTDAVDPTDVETTAGPTDRAEPPTQALPRTPAGAPGASGPVPTGVTGTSPGAADAGSAAPPQRSIQDWMAEEQGTHEGADRPAGPTTDAAVTAGRDVTAAPAAPVGARVGTVVWGLVLVLLGAAVVAIGAGYEIDLEATLIAVLLLAGVSLLVGALATTARGTRRR